MLRVRKTLEIVVFALFLLTGVVATGHAQQVADTIEENEGAEPNGNSAEPADSSGLIRQDDAARQPFDAIAFKARADFMVLLSTITAALLVFTLCVLVVVTWKVGLSSEFTRTLILVIIVFAGLYLISAGYSNEQAAPVYGLLGTIAGYLFGRGIDDSARRRDAGQPTPTPPTPPAPERSAGTISTGPGEGL